MKKIILFISCFVMSLGAIQLDSREHNISLKSLPKSIIKHLEPNHSVLFIKSGDLNRDKINDMIVVSKDMQEDNESRVDEFSRGLYLFIGNKSGSYTLVKKNNNVVYGKDSGGIFGDPFERISIKNGYFSIEHHGGSNLQWLVTISFKYDKIDKDWYLYQLIRSNFHTSDPEIVETQVQTADDFGRVSFEEYKN